MSKLVTAGIVGVLFLMLLGIACTCCNDGGKSTDRTNRSLSEVPSDGDAESRTDDFRPVPTPSQTPEQKPTPVYMKGDRFIVGYTQYSVLDAKWTYHLSDNPYLDQAPDAMFLVVELTVTNRDKKARTIPSFKLIDEKGSEYDTSSKGVLLDKCIGALDSLNPDVSKQGFIVFDVPQNHDYMLLLSGGFWSTDKALVDLSLTGKPPVATSRPSLSPQKTLEPNIKHGLAEFQRKEVFAVLCAAHTEAQKDAEIVYPMLKPGDPGYTEEKARQREEQHDKTRVRRLKGYEDEIARERGLTTEQLAEIYAEGIEKNWPKP